MQVPPLPLGRVGLVFLIACSTPACGEGDTREDPGDGGAGAGGAPTTCEAPTGEPIIHEGQITADETWRADAVHIVEGYLKLSGGVTLTLDACAQVRMRPRAGFELRADGNGIHALGETNRRVTIVADDPALGWGNIRLYPTSTLTLLHTTLEDGGREPANDDMRAVLDVYGDPTQPLQAVLHVEQVEIVRPDVVGVALTENAGFTSESSGLVITGAGLYPLRVWPTALTHIPSGDYTGNARDELVIVGRPLTVDATIKDRGVPYLVGDERSTVKLSVGAEDDGLATLTIEPGVELKFKANGLLELEHFTGDFPASGALVAVGTADAPIVFTSAGATVRGAWQGLYFGGVPDASNRIEYARIEYAGGATGSQGFNCSDVENGRDQAAVMVLGLPSKSFVQSTHIAHSGGFGIDRGWSGPDHDFVDSNTFEDIAWCLQSAPYAADGTCPTAAACQRP